MTTASVRVFARWKVKEGHLQTVIHLLKKVREATLLEKGNLFYDIFQSKADANTLVLFEGYADVAAQQTHRDTDHFRNIVIEVILPLLEDRDVILAAPLEL